MLAAILLGLPLLFFGGRWAVGAIQSRFWPPDYAIITIDATHTLKIASAKGPVTLLGVTAGPHVLGTSERRYRYAVGPKENKCCCLNSP